MPIKQEVFIEAPPARGAFFIVLQSIMRWLLKLPLLCHLRPLARKVRAVTEPVGRLSVQPLPGSIHRTKKETITIASANLWHDWPKHHQFIQRLESIAGMVKAKNADGITHKLHNPWGRVIKRSRLDYIFLRPGKAKWKVLETRHLDGCDGPHSDHRAVLTRLVINQ